MLLVHLFILHALIFVPFLVLLVSGFGCGFWLWHSLDFSNNFFLVYFVNQPLSVGIQIQSCPSRFGLRIQILLQNLKNAKHNFWRFWINIIIMIVSIYFLLLFIQHSCSLITCVPANIDVGQLQLILDSSKFRMRLTYMYLLLRATQETPCKVCATFSFRATSLTYTHWKAWNKYKFFSVSFFVLSASNFIFQLIFF